MTKTEKVKDVLLFIDFKNLSKWELERLESEINSLIQG